MYIYLLKDCWYVDSEIRPIEIKIFKNKEAMRKAYEDLCNAKNEYINITKGFVQSIIDNALPQSRNKLYSRNGNIIQSQPQSVVVNTLF